MRSEGSRPARGAPSMMARTSLAVARQARRFPAVDRSANVSGPGAVAGNPSVAGDSRSTMPNAKNNAGRVLVVDDQPSNLRIISALLSRQGFSVYTAESGEDALQRLQQQLPDLMLLDMMMPGMDGFDLLEELRQNPAWSGVPVVFLTAAHDRDLLLRAFDSGAVDYVTKPFMPEELLARVQAHIGLKLTRDRLERVARERQELVNLVAHDLKNPLTSIFFASDMLITGQTREDRVPRYLQMVRDSAEDALGYIRRYLETQASARSRDALAPSRACLGEMVRWVDQRYALQLEDRGARLRIGSVQEVDVAVDPLVLRQVCENLISNAIKYAPGSDIELSVQPGAPGFRQLRVEDRGPGIPPAQQSSLFTPFFRIGSGDTATDADSTGLGLSLARQIIGASGGDLRYEDREGGGARFILELPEAPA
ncbi:hybrid sensor histidine kinase/response regulator [Luteimonas viscosa]|uniref:histidine kinase n=2 Tax=Luteimonas viscosa TaxID=1132694 RepID=A0A5D4XRD7_9GAMM|nr:hybrid sensor histidine kinase/response regulator [Luteimonas viscosa]